MLRRAGALVFVTCLAACGTFLGLTGDDEDDDAPPPADTSDAQSSDATNDSTVSIIDDGGGVFGDAASDAASDAAKDAAPDVLTVVACNGDAGCARYVFVTSETYVGGFGAATANAKCKTLADKSMILDVRNRQWRAWVSTQSQNAMQRLQVEGTQRYRLTNNTTKVADNFQDLIDNSIDAPITLDENGAEHLGQDVWTGTQGNGTWVTTDCNGWSDGGTNGKVGTTTPISPTGWTEYADRSCALQARLYCFEY